MEKDRILDIRRIFIKPKKGKIPNPEFTETNRKTREVCEKFGGTYAGPPEFIAGFIGDITEERSHIEYKLICEHCKTASWVRRRDAKFCTAGCRKLHYDKVKRESALTVSPKSSIVKKATNHNNVLEITGRRPIKKPVIASRTRLKIEIQ